ncbi:MAG: hypothetical protein K2P59_03055 [Acetatifactor sp.]|nr:hypothetical protein [Acetatifactor sp.]
MKKSYLIESIMFLAGGVIFMAAALLTDTVLDSLFVGFASGAVCAGIANFCRYFYWKAPRNAERYRERLEAEKIEMHDELKVKLRDRSGRYAYALGLGAVSVSIVIFSILGQMEVIGNSRLIVLYLGGYLVFQIVVGHVIYRHMLKKY